MKLVFAGAGKSRDSVQPRRSAGPRLTQPSRARRRTLRTRGGERRETAGNLTISRLPAIDLTGLVGVQFAVSVHVFPALISELRTFKPDLIHVHNLFFRNSEAAAVIARFSSTPLLLTMHLGDMGGGFSAVKALTTIYEQTVGRCIGCVQSASMTMSY